MLSFTILVVYNTQDKSSSPFLMIKLLLDIFSINKNRCGEINRNLSILIKAPNVNNFSFVLTDLFKKEAVNSKQFSPLYVVYVFLKKYKQTGVLSRKTALI